MSRRVNIRRGGGGGGGGSGDGGGASYRTIFGTNLIALWHSQLGIATVSGEVSTWTDQIAGLVLNAPSALARPVYAADGVRFGSKPVVQCSVASGKCLFTAAVPAALIPAASRPWIATVYRERNTPFQTNFQLKNAGEKMAVFNNNTLNYQTFMFGAARVQNIPASLNVARVETYVDGVNAHLVVNGTDNTAACATTYTNPVTEIEVGADDGQTQTSDASFALFLICAALPTAAQIAAYYALANAEFPP